jgi:hypothetical protein
MMPAAASFPSASIFLKLFNMRIENLHIGMKVRHPAYGAGSVVAINERTADIRFDDDSVRTVSPENSAIGPAEPTVEVSGLEIPLETFVKRIAGAVVDELGLEPPESVVDELGARWNDGRMVLHPADPSLQTKEIPLETFFHKIVMMRNNLRVLEQKVNGHEKLTDAEKVELQQYITRCYGSMTTFNILFRAKDGQFGG